MKGLLIGISGTTSTEIYCVSWVVPFMLGDKSMGVYYYSTLKIYKFKNGSRDW